MRRFFRILFHPLANRRHNRNISPGLRKHIHLRHGWLLFFNNYLIFIRLLRDLIHLRRSFSNKPFLIQLNLIETNRLKMKSLRIPFPTVFIIRVNLNNLRVSSGFSFGYLFSQSILESFSSFVWHLLGEEVSGTDKVSVVCFVPEIRDIMDLCHILKRTYLFQ